MSSFPTPTDEIAALRRELEDLRSELMHDARYLACITKDELQRRQERRSLRRMDIRDRLRELGEKV